MFKFEIIITYVVLSLTFICYPLNTYVLYQGIGINYTHMKRKCTNILISVYKHIIVFAYTSNKFLMYLIVKSAFQVSEGVNWKKVSSLKGYWTTSV